MAGEALRIGAQPSESLGGVRVDRAAVPAAGARAGHPEQPRIGAKASTKPAPGKPFREHRPAGIARAHEQDAELTSARGAVRQHRQRPSGRRPRGPWRRAWIRIDIASVRRRGGHRGRMLPGEGSNGVIPDRIPNFRLSGPRR